MKKTRYMMMALLTVMAAVSCKKPVNPDNGGGTTPSVTVTAPAVTTKTVAAGESVTLSFNAPVAWEVSIDNASSAWFWIDDNGVKAYKVKGQPGNVNITVKVSDVEEFDQTRKCSVTVRMDGKDYPLAEITKASNQRTISVYGGKTDASGSFLKDENDTYICTEDVAGGISLVWNEGRLTYICPVRVTANFDWSIPEAGCPEWFGADKTAGKAGEQVIVLITAKSDKLPLDSQEGKVRFIDISNSSADIMSVSITTPGCKDICSGSFAEKAEFNMLGLYSNSGSWTAEGASGFITGPSGAAVLAFGPDGSKAEWLTITDEWNSNDASVIQSRRFTVKAGQNMAPERTAILYAVPASKAGSYSPSEADRIGSVHQAGIMAGEGWGVLSPVNSEYMMAVRGASFRRAGLSDPAYNELYKNYGTDEIYVMKYNSVESSEYADFISSQTVASRAYLDASLEESPNSAEIDLIALEGNEKQMYIKAKSSEVGQTGVVLKDAQGKATAVILFSMDTSWWPAVRFEDIDFVMRPGDDFDWSQDADALAWSLPGKGLENLELTEVKSGALYDKYHSDVCTVWKLVYKKTDSQYNAMIWTPPVNSDDTGSYEFHPSESWLKAEPGEDEQSKKPYLHVQMSSQDPANGWNGDGHEGYIVLKAGDVPVLVLICVREFI